MKVDTLKIFLISLTFAMVIPSVQAQFDDVYYDADQIDYGSHYGYSDSYSTGENDGITYYDNDEYGYFDDYDYYYTSRIRRFYRPYVGFGFYDPCYVSYNYYDPYAYNYYGYPGASIYLGFGFGFGFGYSWNSWNNCGPYGGYYNGYWGGYGNCYNNYYACTPVACYVPPVYYPVVPGGGYNDVYYGPRVSGNTGASPRVPTVTEGTRPPGYTIPEKGVAQPNIEPGGQTPADLPGIANKPGTTKHSMPDATTPAHDPITLDDAVASVNGQNPVDRELPKDKPSSPKRPVFKPDVKYQPYPTPERTNTNNVTDRPSTDRPSYKPYTPDTRSSGSATKDNFKPYPQTDKPARTNATPPQTTPNTRSKADRPSYTPPPRSNQNKENARPSGGNNRPDYSPPSGRSNSKPSYSPPSGRSNSKPNYSPPSRSSKPSSGNSGGRSSGSGGSKSSTSPRGRG
jgi:hypothetical protein